MRECPVGGISTVLALLGCFRRAYLEWLDAEKELFDT